MRSRFMINGSELGLGCGKMKDFRIEVDIADLKLSGHKHMLMFPGVSTIRARNVVR